MTVELTVPLTRDDAIRTFCEAEYAALLRYCLRLVHEEQLARDITQEAFVRLFSRWVGVAEPRGYVYLVATNLARRTWRRRRSEQAALHVVAPADTTTALPDFDVRDAVERLPRRWRDVVLLHYFADLTVAQVAVALKQPEGTVKRTLAEARALLAKSLGGTS